MSLAYALLAAIAAMVGACVRDVRPIAALFWANWLICVVSYQGDVAASLAAVGLYGEDVWTVADAICAGVAFAIGWRHWWGWTLWGLYTFQCCYHVVSALGLIDDGAYSDALDAVFVVQAVVLIVAGGKDVADRLSAGLRWLHRLCSRFSVSQAEGLGSGA